MRRLMKYGVLLLILSAGSGCGSGLKASGASPWPVLPTVKELDLSDSEKAMLLEWRSSNEGLFNRIQMQGAQMRAIIKKYNEKTRENNRRILESLGYDKQQMEDIYRNE